MSKTRSPFLSTDQKANFRRTAAISFMSLFRERINQNIIAGPNPSSMTSRILEMRKSDIVIAIIKRSDKSITEQEIRREIHSSLAKRSVRFEKWDSYVSEKTGKAIIVNLRAPYDSVQYLIRDIDTILATI